jgi:hypothetical protein
MIVLRDEMRFSLDGLYAGGQSLEGMAGRQARILSD